MMWLVDDFLWGYGEVLHNAVCCPSSGLVGGGGGGGGGGLSLLNVYVLGDYKTSMHPEKSCVTFLFIVLFFLHLCR